MRSVHWRYFVSVSSCDYFSEFYSVIRHCCWVISELSQLIKTATSYLHRFSFSASGRRESRSMVLYVWLLLENIFEVFRYVY